MVTSIDEKPTEIWTPCSDPRVENLKKEVQEELLMFAKDAAESFRCNPEELKFQLVYDQITEKPGYNFERMTPREMDERKADNG